MCPYSLDAFVDQTQMYHHCRCVDRLSLNWNCALHTLTTVCPQIDSSSTWTGLSCCGSDRDTTPRGFLCGYPVGIHCQTI